MQLGQVLRMASPRVWVIAAVPAAALALLVLFLTLSSPTYKTSATVGVTSPTGIETAASVTQNVDSFRSALQSEAVRRAASADAGISMIAEKDVTTSRIGASNLVQIDLAIKQLGSEKEVILSLVHHANDLLFTPSRNAATAQRESAAAAYTKLQAEVAKKSKTGLVIPIEQYRATAAEVTQLRVAVAAARARDAIEAPGLAAALETATDDLSKRGQQVRDLDELTYSYDRARDRVSDADATLDATEARLVAADSETAVKLGRTEKSSERARVLRALVAGLVVGVVTGVGLVVLISVLRSGDDDRPGGGPEDEPYDGRDDDPVTGSGNDVGARGNASRTHV